MRCVAVALVVLSVSAAHIAEVASAMDYRNTPGISNAEYATRTHRAGMALLRSKRTAEAVDLAIDAARARPTKESYEVLQTLSTLASVHRDLDSNLKGMHWLRAEAGEFGRSARFLGNLAHTEELAGNTAESINVRNQIVESHPGGEAAAHQLAEMIRLYLHEGDQESARLYATKLAEGDYPEKYLEYGRRALNRINGVKESPHLETFVLPSGRDRASPVLFVIGVVSAILVVLLMFAVLLVLRSQPRRHGHA